MTDTTASPDTSDLPTDLLVWRRRARRLTALGIILALLLLLCQCSEYREPVAVNCTTGTEGAATATLQGLVQTVTDQPAPDATVTLRQGDTIVRTTVTDAGGRFALGDLEPGTYDFEGAAEGFRALDEEIAITGCLAEAVVTVGSDVSPLLIFLPAPYL